MSRNRFVSPEVVRLPLSDGDWIEVKKNLSMGETLHFRCKAFKDLRSTGTEGTDAIGIDFSELKLSRAEAYLTDWSFKDAHDKPVKLCRAAIEALREDAFAEIDAALDAHLAAMIQEKKEPRGDLMPASASPSVAG